MEFKYIKDDLEKILEAQFHCSPLSLDDSSRISSWADSRYFASIDYFTGKTTKASEVGWIRAIEDMLMTERIDTREKASRAFMDSIAIYLYHERVDELERVKSDMDVYRWKSQSSLIQSMIDVISDSSDLKFELVWDSGGYGFKPTGMGGPPQVDKDLQEKFLDRIKEYREKEPIIDSIFLKELAKEKQILSPSFDPYLEKGVYICLDKGDDREIKFAKTILTDEKVIDMISGKTEEILRSLGSKSKFRKFDEMLAGYYIRKVTGDLETDIMSFKDTDIVAGPFKDEREARLSSPFVFSERYFKGYK